MFNSSHSRAHYAEIMNWKTDGDYQAESDAPQTIYMWESQLRPLDLSERMLFLGLFVAIIALGVVGNILTLYVVVTRQQRLLFKTCLLSLATSDLLFLASSGSSYLGRLSQENSLLWALGYIGCRNIPFIQTVAILVGSTSLVAIALDRYLAVRNKSKTDFLRSKRVCFSGLILVWLVSCAISSPALFSYDILDIYVIPDDNLEAFYKAYFCWTNMDESLMFYIILFSFIFAPIFLAFVWLNAIIAREIWKRRHAPGTQSLSKSKRADEDSSTAEIKDTDETYTSSNGRHPSSKISSGECKNSAVSAPVFTVEPQSNAPANVETRRNGRQRRQMRMFKVILVLMSVFIMCRLPNWIFLIYKLTYQVTGKVNWLLYYSFGIMGLVNCMLNPLLYTFLGETLRIGSACHKLCRLCRRTRKTTSHYANNQAMFAAADAKRKSDGGIYLGS